MSETRKMWKKEMAEGKDGEKDQSDQNENEGFDTIEDASQGEANDGTFENPLKDEKNEDEKRKEEVRREIGNIDNKDPDVVSGESTTEDPSNNNMGEAMARSAEQRKKMKITEDGIEQQYDTINEAAKAESPPDSAKVFENPLKRDQQEENGSSEGDQNEGERGLLDKAKDFLGF